MTTGFFTRLDERARRIDSLLCVGLDPHPADLPQPSAAAARDFSLRLIEATHDLALTYKPNAAFFEALGPAGWEALAEVIAAVPQGTPVILDAKRGDISSTAEAYARSAFERLGADAITLNPYLGRDTLEPFLKDPQRGVFLLCKTSNPGAGDLQDLPLGGADQGLKLYEKVAQKAQEWNSNDNLGLVTGATHPEALARLRQLAPDLWFLAPGVGAQGADLTATLQAGLRADGLGLLVQVSRGISRAADPAGAKRLLAQIRRQLDALAASATRCGPHGLFQPWRRAAAGWLRALWLSSPQIPGSIPDLQAIYAKCLASRPAGQVARYLPSAQRNSTRLAALPYASPAHCHGHQPAGQLANALPAQGGQSLRHQSRNRRRLPAGRARGSDR